MSWEDVLKAPIDLKWLKLMNGIKNDAMPSDKKKYVRYSNLDKINRNMVEYYFKVGKNKKKRQSALNGILEEMLRSSNARYDIEDKGGEDIIRSLKKKQTTLQGFDPKIVERLVESDKSNIWIAPIEDSDIPNEEKSRLSDKMLDELARLNVGNKFTITSATGRSGQWGTEPSFMLTGVPTSLESKIYEMADKYNQDAIAVSAKGEKGAKFITPKGKVTDEFEDMEFDPDAEYSTEFPSGQRLTFKSLDKWKDIIKLLPPKEWEGVSFQETSDKTFKEVKVEGEVWGKFTGAINEDGSIFTRPHYLWAVTNRSPERGKSPRDEIENLASKIMATKKTEGWIWRFHDVKNIEMIGFSYSGGKVTFNTYLGKNEGRSFPLKDFANIWEEPIGEEIKRKKGWHKTLEDNPAYRGQELNRVDTHLRNVFNLKKSISYSAIVLDEESRNKLLGLVPEGWKPIAHHMTIKLGPLRDSKYKVGDKVSMNITAIGIDDRAMAVKVDVERDDDKFAHVTIAVNPDGGKPFHSNQIKDFEKYSGKLSGVVEEVPNR